MIIICIKENTVSKNFVKGKCINHWQRLEEIPATTVESDALAKDLKKRGMTKKN